MTWRDSAACAGRWPELDYFSAEPTMVAACKQVCSTCPVVEPCRQWANDNAACGVWGGMTEDKRRVYWRDYKRRIRSRVSHPLRLDADRSATIRPL